MATIILLWFGLIMCCIPLGAVLNANKEKKRRRQNVEDMKDAYLSARVADKTTNSPKNFAELMYGGGNKPPRIDSYRMYGSQP